METYARAVHLHTVYYTPVPLCTLCVYLYTPVPLCTLCVSTCNAVLTILLPSSPPLHGIGAGGSVAESAELKRNPSGVSTTSVTFCKRPVYIATPASNHETGSNSGDSITGADVEMVTYTPLASVDAQSGRSNANGRAELLAISPRKAENFTNVDVADGLPRTDRSGTETSV